MDVLTHTAHEAGLEGGTLQPLVNGACSFYPYPYPYLEGLGLGLGVCGAP